MDIHQVRADLRAEQEELDRIVSTIDADSWLDPTPSEGWTIADQIGHLTYFDEAAVLAISDPATFKSMVGRLAEAISNEGVDQLTLASYRQMRPPDLLSAWRTGRTSLFDYSGRLRDESRVEWYGPSMGAKSFLTARLMETWAHGQDIVDALGVVRPATDRMRHIVQLGVITRSWSYVNRGLTAPDLPVFVQLRAPSGGHWEFGDRGAADTVTGAAEDFCLVVTQRRHLDDTALKVTDLARDWLEKSQAFAGPPTEGPRPGQRT